MQKHIHPEREGYKLLAIPKIAFVVILSLVACSEVKQDQKALDRVTAKLPLLERAAEIVRERFPCANAVVNKSDTTIHVDSNFTVIVSSDTISNTIHDTVTRTKVILQTQTIHDTATVVDGELTNRQLDTINSLRIQLASCGGQILQQSNVISIENKLVNKWRLYAILTWVLFILGLGLGIYIKSIKKLP